MLNWVKTEPLTEQKTANGFNTQGWQDTLLTGPIPKDERNRQMQRLIGRWRTRLSETECRLVAEAQGEKWNYDAEEYAKLDGQITRAYSADAVYEVPEPEPVKAAAAEPVSTSFSTYAEHVIAPKARPMYRKTGLASLDAGLNGGLVPGQLVIINGLPSVGKTNLEDHLAAAFAKAGLRTIFAEGEMSDIEIRARLCAAQADLAVTKIEDAFYGERALDAQFEGQRLVLAARQLDLLPLQIHGRVKTVAALRALVTEYPCDMLIVGVLQRFLPPEGMEPGRHAVEADINALKDIAQEFNITVIAASHVQRPLRTKNDGERQPIFYPTKESARESGQIEGLADVMILLARDMASESAIERHKLYWRVAKVRRGREMPRFLPWTVNSVNLKIRDTAEACAAMKTQRLEEEQLAKDEEKEQQP